MSTRYAADERVKVSGDGLGYTLPDPVGGDWQIRPDGYGGFNAFDGDGQFVSAEGDHYSMHRARRFETADEAIRFVIGDPQ